MRSIAAFYADDTERGFLHSHSYTGQRARVRAALAVLDIFRADDVLAANRVKAARWTALAAPLAAHPKVRDFRHRGMIWAFEVDTGSRRLRALVLRGGPRARAPAAADRPHRLFHAALHPDRRRVRAARRAHARDRRCGMSRAALRLARCRWHSPSLVAAAHGRRAALPPRARAGRSSTRACRSTPSPSSCRT